MGEALTPKDFTTDQEVRWCPGCGDYAILKAVRAVLADIGRPPHEVVFVSGIGCAARFPYYIDTYGFHTIHGRAPAFAIGIKAANPDLDIWVVGGDGDLLSIGGNHLVHTLRRNIDLNILLFNNAIYGLTKGQYSPSSPIGTHSPSSPRGSVDAPINAAMLALGSGARFVARSGDTTIQHLSDVMKRGHAYRGASFVEIFQNCIIYYDGVWDGIASKTTRADKSVFLTHGQPLIFGKDQDKGLVWRAEAGIFEIIIGTTDEVGNQATMFDETNFAQAVSLARMDRDGFPVALGVLYCDPAETAQPEPGEKLDAAGLQKILDGSESWRVG